MKMRGDKDTSALPIAQLHVPEVAPGGDRDATEDYISGRFG